MPVQTEMPVKKKKADPGGEDHDENHEFPWPVISLFHMLLYLCILMFIFIFFVFLSAIIVP